MKKILITGAGSYIGTSFEKYIKEQYANQYEIDTIDMIDETWRKKSFVGYDTIYHVAGIAHSDTGKISAEKEKLYRAVNTDLAIETASKAKTEGVRQFIFMSSAIIYGESAPIGKMKVITKDTVPAPSNCYSDSKYQAELGILPLQDETFKIVILRPPMIYGKGCKGNFSTLKKMAERLLIFPKVKNQRSMLYVGNLVEFVRLMIENEESGTFWPQNSEYSNTSEIVKMIAAVKGKKVFLIPGFGWGLKLMSHISALINKAFGNLCYEQSMSAYKDDYQRVDLKQSIKDTVL